MQGFLKAHQLARVLRRPSSPILLYSVSRVQSPCILEPIQSNCNSSLCRGYFTSGTIYGNYIQTECNLQRNICQCQKCSMLFRASFSTEAGIVESGATESVKELYDKMLKSVVDQRSAPPNAWLWSLIQSCVNHEDANLLFDILQRLRIFRLSNLRIHENFNCALCQEITKACVRVGVIDLGDVDALWKIEKIRSETMKERTLGSGLSCAKGFLVDHKPEDAAAIIHLLNQTVPDSRRQKFMVELQKLVADWPLEVIKRQKDERRKELAATLEHDIRTMLSALSNMGLKLNVNVEDLTRIGVVLS
ncbi:uncharacterized protein LOC129893307 [Solanum dulcamara]|uniref:uncharacterized protein LOC129893307 n=1 Tax=Solanum dulcamara TaxID=45834 RepID=UPI0024853439|nr:uncharacterized protein LOC129893307 [Solanum dulcamara]